MRSPLPLGQAVWARCTKPVTRGSIARSRSKSFLTRSRRTGSSANCLDREARAISQLTHPHICTLYDVGGVHGTAFLVLEYLEAETLADRLTNGALPLDDALQVAMQIADALSAAHRQGIVHRDLKPGNVMLTKAGAKLLDFGLAKTGAAAAASGLSMLATTP